MTLLYVIFEKSPVYDGDFKKIASACYSLNVCFWYQIHHIEC